MKHEAKDLNAPSRWNMRIWDDDNGEWVCQSDKDALTYYGFDITGGETTEFQGLPKWHPDRHLIWEQSTGLKDKNGKEVYEGDIVKLTGKVAANKCSIYKVGWDGFLVAFNLFPLERNKSDIGFLNEAETHRYNVIGNIHEKPELLGEDE